MDLNAEITRSLLREEQQMSDENDTKTPAEWCRIEGVGILDPDGWRGVNGRPWNDTITLAEFKTRLIDCTQRSVAPSKAALAELGKRDMLRDGS